MWGYERRLARDLERWTANGWVSADAAARMRADAAQSGGGVSMPAVLGILASVLFGFAVMSFVAAHWEEMPRLTRLGLLLALLWAGYGAAGVFALRGARVFADASVLFASVIFGASIMLISQMFHINGHPPDGILLWSAGTLIAGVALRSNPALALTLVLVCVWTAMEMGARDTVFWPFLIGWGLVAAAFYWQGWRPGFHLSAIVLSAFIISLGYFLQQGHEHLVVAAIGLALAAAALVFERVSPAWQNFTAATLGYAIVIAFCGLFALQFIDSPYRSNLLAIAAFTLVMLVAAIAYGLWKGHRGPLWIGYVAFSIEILAVYWQTVGSILGTSLFFLIAGLIVAGLAGFAWRLARGRVDGRGLV